MTSPSVQQADAIVVGAGPAGSSAAAYLAGFGLDVVLLEKTSFPRDKVCGDGLTPRAVKELITLGVSTEDPGWMRSRGLRLIGGGHRVEIDWPESSIYPNYGLARARNDFDYLLARHAVARGARLVQRANVSGPIRDEATGRLRGVQVKVMDERGRPTGETTEYHAPFTLACDGNSSRLSLAMDRPRREDRPMGVGVRTYFKTPRSTDDYMESWMELWTPSDPQDPSSKPVLLPGYGWIFALSDGTSNVGLGILDTSPSFRSVDCKEVLRRWVDTLPAEWTFTPENMTSPIRGAALPMALNRRPLYRDGLFLLGDAGGMISPFNGEGIAHAMEAARIAAQTISGALDQPDQRARERVAATYPGAVEDELGGYFMLGAQFARIIGHPEIMRLAVRHGLPRRTLMRFVVKIMAGLAEPSGGGLDDRVIAALTRVTPSA
ncbi:geranylgeranyl reductase family protein [Gephyromycinifex aptenodytis]|uniref:geranylgeranyl reductase family protein n=1 Tax=Gephyromycinifex aptenodytis TaxID=2716227 RepID=UPI00144706F7|nr:geranylgeranyl reductase family protein [Gephyromycinifex aptenodytis]